VLDDVGTVKTVSSRILTTVVANEELLSDSSYSPEIPVQHVASVNVHLGARGNVIVSSGAGGVALGGGVQRLHVGGGHVGAAACFHWCRWRNQEMVAVGRRSVDQVGRGLDEGDSMATGHAGFAVCDQ